MAKMQSDVAQEKGPVVIDVPLLYETGMDAWCEEVWCAYVPKKIQIERLMARNSLTREDAESRLDVQMSADAKLARADFGLINNGGLDHLRKQCFELVSQLRSTL